MPTKVLIYFAGREKPVTLEFDDRDAAVAFVRNYTRGDPVPGCVINLDHVDTMLLESMVSEQGEWVEVDGTKVRTYRTAEEAEAAANR